MQIDKINLILPHFDERLKRIYPASEADDLGRGKEISELLGIHQNTLIAGRQEPVRGEWNYTIMPHIIFEQFLIVR